MSDQMEALLRLAELHGIELSYYTIEGRRRDAKPEVLLAVLKAMGAPLHRMEDAPEALRAAEGRTPSVPAGTDHEPTQAFTPKPAERRWGVFLPLYAFRSSNDWGVGSFTDLERLVDWVADLGGGIVGTLPLLASFLDESFPHGFKDDGQKGHEGPASPSPLRFKDDESRVHPIPASPFAPCPYTPVSRLFWNELFIHVERVPDLENSPAARNVLASADLQADLRRLRDSALVDYRLAMQVKRRLLDSLAESTESRPCARRDAWADFRRAHPSLHDYARFRAATETLKRPWRAWPEPARNGIISPESIDPVAERYHSYVQWIADEQMALAAQHARTKNVLLYLDFPLGVHPDGYDAWRYRDFLVDGVSVGAPPDPFFAKGQRWGFAPWHPQRMASAAESLWPMSLRRHMECAGLLRIDHVMGLHRLFWIPDGFEAVDGVYVRYPKQDLYDALCRESQASRCILVGEDLGTVPADLREELHRRGILRLFILAFEQDLTAGRPFPQPPTDCLAGLNTHDIPPFAALWGDRADRPAAFQKCLDHLASGPASCMLVNLEDLWFETEPQNRPGTTEEFPNWRRKARLSFEQFSTEDSVLTRLKRVNRLRRQSS